MTRQEFERKYGDRLVAVFAEMLQQDEADGLEAVSIYVSEVDEENARVQICVSMDWDDGEDEREQEWADMREFIMSIAKGLGDKVKS